jgi:hypothetical protein
MHECGQSFFSSSCGVSWLFILPYLLFLLLIAFNPCLRSKSWYCIRSKANHFPSNITTNVWENNDVRLNDSDTSTDQNRLSCTIHSKKQPETSNSVKESIKNRQDRRDRFQFWNHGDIGLKSKKRLTCVKNGSHKHEYTSQLVLQRQWKAIRKIKAFVESYLCSSPYCEILSCELMYLMMLELPEGFLQLYLDFLDVMSFWLN